MNKLAELKAQKRALVQKAQAILDLADAEGRQMNDEERQNYDAQLDKVDTIQADIERRERMPVIQVTQPLAQPVVGHRTDPGVGLSDRERRDYSVVRAIRAAVNDDWSDAGLELEASRAVEQQTGKPASSFYIPFDALQAPGRQSQRTYTPGLGWSYRAAVTTTVGADIIQDTLLTDNFIDMLRNRMVVQQAGATVLTDLSGGIVSIPKQTGGATLYWVAEDGDITESNQTFSDVNLTPKTAGALSSITRLMLVESSVDIERMVRDDLAKTLALGIDAAALNGTGASNQPTGIASTSGINDPSVSALAWSDVVKFETMVASDNADLGKLAYITSPKVRGHWKVTDKASGAAQFIWQGGPNPVNEHPCYISNQVSDIKGAGTNESQVFYGNWADLIIAMWSGIDILVDPFTYGKKGRVQLVSLVNLDLGVRNAVSFAYDSVAI